MVDLDYEEALKPQEATQYLGVCRSTLYAYVKKGLLPLFRTPGGHSRFLRRDLDKIRQSPPKRGPVPKEFP